MDFPDAEIQAQYNRVKGAEWFNEIRNTDFVIGGAGGIGSWTTFLLARAGANYNISLYDHDSYEVHNMSGQLCRRRDIGNNKAQAVSNIIVDYTSNGDYIDTYGMYTTDSIACPVMISAFDNMAARKTMFMNWFEHVKEMDEEDRKHAMFFDGRLLAEQYQIFCVPADIAEINKYNREYLFDDAEVQDVDCTFKQTSHVAAMIGGHIVALVTNHLTNASYGFKVRKTPFLTEMFLPLNMMTCS